MYFKRLLNLNQTEKINLTKTMVRGFKTHTGFDEGNLSKAGQADVKHSEYLSMNAFKDNNPQLGKEHAGLAARQRDVTFIGPKDRGHTLRRDKMKTLSEMTNAEANKKYNKYLGSTRPGDFPPHSEWDGNVGRTRSDDAD